MCIRTNGLILILTFLLINLLQAKDLSLYKKICEDKGLTPKTENFANCVMKELKNKGKNNTNKIISSRMSSYKESCKEIGFVDGTEKFGKCVIKLYKKDKNNNKIIEAERKEREAKREYELEQLEIKNSKRETEINLAKERLELERRRVEIEEERANREKWNNISKGLKSLSDNLYGNQNQRNDDYERQLCINECRTQGDNYSYCQRVCR